MIETPAADRIVRLSRFHAGVTPPATLAASDRELYVKVLTGWTETHELSWASWTYAVDSIPAPDGAPLVLYASRPITLPGETTKQLGERLADRLPELARTAPAPLIAELFKLAYWLPSSGNESVNVSAPIAGRATP